MGAAMLAGAGWQLGSMVARAFALALIQTRGWREWLRALISVGVGIAAAHGLVHGGLWVWGALA